MKKRNWRHIRQWLAFLILMGIGITCVILALGEVLGPVNALSQPKPTKIIEFIYSCGPVVLIRPQKREVEVYTTRAVTEAEMNKLRALKSVISADYKKIAYFLKNSVVLIQLRRSYRLDKKYYRMEFLMRLTETLSLDFKIEIKSPCRVQ